ncbi:TIGR01620 family protein [Pistricoccus aurantiacus]|uniref:TIGR01620 family protein n=1 Tax=Pistricoccus aurantiacus TaxID=1883414 RepID=UPI003634F0C8
MSKPTHSKPASPRPAQRFSLDEMELDETDLSSSTFQDPRPTERFESSQETQPLTVRDTPSPAEDALAASLARPRKRRIGLLFLLTSALGLGVIEAGQTVYAAALGGDWLAGAWSVLGLTALGLGAAALLKELWRLRRLRRHGRLREKLDDLDGASTRQALGLAETLRQQLGLDKDHPHWRNFLAAKESHHDGAEIRALLAHHLLTPRDREARRLISRMSSDTAIMVAVSPMTLVDMLLVAWRNLALIDRLARLYGLELGYASRLKLLRQVLYNMAFAGASEIASDAGMGLLSMNLAGRLSTRAGQGLGVGLLSARLGLRTLGLARPLPFETGQAPRLGDLRRDLWQRLRQLETRDTQPPG